MSRHSSRSRGNSVRNKAGADKTKDTEPSPFKKARQGGANNLKIKSQRTTDSVPNSYEVQSQIHHRAIQLQPNAFQAIDHSQFGRSTEANMEVNSTQSHKKGTVTTMS